MLRQVSRGILYSALKSDTVTRAAQATKDSVSAVVSKASDVIDGATGEVIKPVINRAAAILDAATHTIEERGYDRPTHVSVSVSAGVFNCTLSREVNPLSKSEK